MTDPIIEAAADALGTTQLRRLPETIAYNEIAETVVASVTPLIRAQIAKEILETPRFTLEDKHAEAGMALGIKHAALIAHGWPSADELRGNND